jgi:hypothetical protein
MRAVGRYNAAVAEDKNANYPDRHDQGDRDRVPLKKEERGYQTPQDQSHEWQRPPKDPAPDRK